MFSHLPETRSSFVCPLCLSTRSPGAGVRIIQSPMCERYASTLQPSACSAREEFARLLEAASEKTLPYWLLGGFAGLRRAEIERLEWKDVHFDSGLIEVPALKAKTASRRFVQIQPNLNVWLQPYRTRSGKVCPANLRNLLDVDRVASGIWKAPAAAVQAFCERSGIDRATYRPSAKLKAWPSNGLRHSFASYHLAHFMDAARLSLELGHTSQDIIFRHYRELVKPDQGAKYWNVCPAVETNLVAISAE